MAQTNFDLAPAPKLVDGLLAVPIDIQRISASLTFDAASQSGSGDATLEFTTGPQDGNPIFDLRQTITAAWLDGAPLPVAKLAHHDFGGGTNAAMRVVEALLPANSTHTLRVSYSLGVPQASNAGSYLPAIQWSSGPRLAFNFGFTDLGAGRYLEAWVPANLIFDQFELVLDLRLLNTTIAHSVITNGTLSVLGVNQWRIIFPVRFTALSPLLELRASDTLVQASSNTTLPVSGANLTVEAWKLTSNTANLTTQIANIKTYLAANEQSTGPYMHGNRFVSFVHVGGMEYEGGATSDTSALRHETFHSWWARGLKPASQADGWVDEGWTEYQMHGGTEVQPFNFADPPVMLCPRNPWVRITAAAAYDAGYRFWKGVAALIGANTLATLMHDFYQQYRDRPFTTARLEEFLICRSGNVQLVDAFHRFVYGFENPATKPELWLRDDPAHTGSELWGGTFWDSPDLWIRNADDGSTSHQNPEYGQDNWFYARVRNNGTTTVRHFVVTFQVKYFAGTEFIYPNDFLPCVTAASGFDLAPGASTIVKARWPRALIPAAGTSPCLVATVLTKGDLPTAGLHVWEQNNLAQKNLTIVNLKPDALMILPFVVSSRHVQLGRRYQIELIRPANLPALEVSLLQRGERVVSPLQGLIVRPFEPEPPAPPRELVGRLDCGAPETHFDDATQIPIRRVTIGQLEVAGRQFAPGVEIVFPAGHVAQVPVLIHPQEQLIFGMRLRVPRDARAGDVIRLDIVQRDSETQRIVGGIAVEVHIQ